MDGLDITITILLNVFPLILLAIPLIFIWKKAIGKLYFRIVLAIFVFYVIYWILPLLFQRRVELDNLGTSDEYGLGDVINYFGVHFGSLITLFASYPLTTLPFIFFVAPFIAFIFVWYYVRKQEGSINENLTQTTYEFFESPFQEIRDKLLENNWKREKDIFKLMIIYLPISLYLLEVILKIQNIEDFSLVNATTALGWFLEILFVYIAIFVFALELLVSSHIALKGRYFGEQIRERTYKSLYTVGIPISVLSLVLFLLEEAESLDIIFSFFSYFIMASIIFILFLDIFEPISLFVFIKLIDWWKNKKQKLKKLEFTNIYYILFFSLLALTLYFVIYFMTSALIYGPLFGSTEEIERIVSQQLFNQDADLSSAFKFDLLNILNFLWVRVIPLVLFVGLLSYGLRYVKSNLFGLISFLLPIVILSIIFNIFLPKFLPPINFAPQEYWLLGKRSYILIDGLEIYTLRSGLFTNLTGILYFISIPFINTRYLFNIIFWTVLVYALTKSFKTKNIPIDDKHSKKIVFSSLQTFLTYKQYKSTEEEFIISKNDPIQMPDVQFDTEKVDQILDKIEEEKLLRDIKPNNAGEEKKFYFLLRFLHHHGLITLWKTEFSFVFENVQKQGLYLIYQDGRGVYDYSFIEDYTQDPGLISGMFSAISSFIKETTKSTELLQTIDHGDITILIEYGEYVFGALFVKGNQSSEVRSQLRDFISTFEQKYKEPLKDWTGALKPFKGTQDLVENIFAE